MINLEYWTGNKWIQLSVWHNEKSAWRSLAGDNFNYRTVDSNTGKVLTVKFDTTY